MNIKSISGFLAVAVAVMGMSSQAKAAYECDQETDLADEIQCHAEALICDENGVWTDIDGTDRNFALWQYRGTGTKGCEVHFKLSKQLFVPHDSPPIGRGKSKAVAKGAANDLRDGKLDSAVQHLCNFRNTIEFDARPNQDKGVDGVLVYNRIMAQIALADAWIMELGFDPAEACYIN